jgi:hypothetical protein
MRHEGHFPPAFPVSSICVTAAIKLEINEAFSIFSLDSLASACYAGNDVSD